MALDNNTVVNYTDKTTIKNWFKTGLKPTQKQFWSTGDSFWHKSESLPISSISGLGNLLDGKAEENHEHAQYATNDAKSLTVDNITAWQQKLGVADLKFDDKAITITQDYTDFGLQAGATINAFNNAIYQSVGNKLDAPTEEGTTTDYPYVVGVNDENEPIKLPAGDLGKNFSNTDLMVSENRKHTGTASVELAMPMIYSNPSQQFSGLTNKSTDATYNLFPVFDSNKKLAFADNPYQMMKNGFSLMTQSQALELGQLLNGGVGSSGMMSVNMISPPYIKLADEDTYVVLRGANLYLNVDDYRIDITDVNGNILSNIPNSQIQLRDSGTDLVFYFNFSFLGQGKYKLKLTSGVKILQTTLSFEVVQNMETVNLNNLTWEVLEKNENQDSASVISPTTITLNRLVNDTTTYLPIISAKSSPIFQAHEDWMLEFEVTFRMNLVPGQQGLSKSIAGVDYEAVQHTLIQSGVAYIYWNKPGSANHISRANYFESPNSLIGFTEGSGNSSSLHNHIRTLNVILVKTGNMITVNSNGYTSTNVVTNGEAYCFLAQISGRQATNSESMSVKLLTAYKF